MKVNPKRLILGLLLAAEGEPLSAREAISACALFGISEGNARVVLLRLSAEGSIESVDRGLYRLSGAAHQLADEVSLWRTAGQRLRDWQGGYVVAHTSALRRGDRSRVHQRERALQMLGFRELEPGLQIRPDNIEADLDALRQRLYAAGLEATAAVFSAADFDKERRVRIAALWDGKALNRSYRALRKQLEDWMARADALDLDVAMRESFLMGGRAIREVVFDPLLPEPMIDAQARAAFFDTVRRFDATGQRIWRQLRAMPAFSPVGAAPRARSH